MNKTGSVRRSTTFLRLTEGGAGYRAGCPRTGRRSPIGRAGRHLRSTEQQCATIGTVAASWLAGVPLTHPRNIALSARLRGEREGTRRVSDGEGEVGQAVVWSRLATPTPDPLRPAEGEGSEYGPPATGRAGRLAHAHDLPLRAQRRRRRSGRRRRDCQPAT